MSVQDLAEGAQENEKFRKAMRERGFAVSGVARYCATSREFP
ncbi:hypothetical protein ACFW5I_36545 [Streptomyces sp. NPDC058818]